MTFSVTEALDRWVLANDDPHPYDGKWHPSAIWGCTRKAVYEIRATPESDPRPPQNRRVLFIGRQFHHFVQSAILDDPQVAECWVEVEVYDDDLNIIGKADALRHMVDDSWEMDEIKSISQNGMNYAKKRNSLPKEDHLGQGKTYADLLRRHGSPAQGILPLGNKLKSIRFTYLAKEDLDTEEIVVDLDPEQDQQKIAERIADLEVYRADPASLPPRLPMSGGKKSWMCEWRSGKCQFFTRCWEQDPDEIEPQGADF